MMPAASTDELVRVRGQCTIRKRSRCFAVCVENSVPVASGAWHAQVWVKVLARSSAHLRSPRPETGSVAGERVHQIELTSIVPSTLQPRKDFARDVLLELIDSIRQHGIIQPLIVRQVGTRFELIAGERRWRAAQELGLATVPAIVRTANDLEVLELSLIENLQRADLNPIEEAQGYARLANEFGMRQEDIALKVGRSRAAVANALRLLDLHPQVQIWLAQNLVSVGHAKVLLALKAPEEQLLAAETVLRRNATVRSTERMVARLLGIGRGRRKSRRGDWRFERYGNGSRGFAKSPATTSGHPCHDSPWRKTRSNRDRGTMERTISSGLLLLLACRSRSDDVACCSRHR